MDGWKCTSHFQEQSYAFPICILESYLPFHHIETIALSPFMAGQPDQTPLPADPSMPWLNSCCSCRNLSLCSRVWGTPSSQAWSLKQCLKLLCRKGVKNEEYRAARGRVWCGCRVGCLASILPPGLLSAPRVLLTVATFSQQRAVSIGCPLSPELVNPVCRNAGEQAVPPPSLRAFPSSFLRLLG